MNLNLYRDEAKRFLEQIGAETEADEKIFQMLGDEIEELKKSIGDNVRTCHQVYDVLFLLFELAAKYDLDLDAEWEKGRQKKAAKYQTAKKG